MSLNKMRLAHGHTSFPFGCSGAAGAELSNGLQSPKYLLPVPLEKKFLTPSLEVTPGALLAFARLHYPL